MMNRENSDQFEKLINEQYQKQPQQPEQQIEQQALIFSNLLGEQNRTLADCKKYAQITSSMRMAFIKKVLSRSATIREASEEFGIKFSTSKAILQTFRKEGRVGKKKFRQRKSKDSNEIQEFPTNKDIETFKKIELDIGVESKSKESLTPELLQEFGMLVESLGIQSPAMKETHVQKIMVDKCCQWEDPYQTSKQNQLANQQASYMQNQYQNQCMMIHPLQLHKFQVQHQRNQIDLEQANIYNQKLIEIIMGFQNQVQQQSQIKQEAEDPLNRITLKKF